MKKYRHLFFDLDGTLWGLARNTRLALSKLFTEFPDEVRNISFEDFFRRYHIHNDRVWALYRDGRIAKEALRYERFDKAFGECGFSEKDFIRKFADRFMAECPHMPHVIEGTHELLNYCSSRYSMHIITNGFIEVQGHKMTAARLNGYFTHVINSEHSGVRKPHPGIFSYALEKSGANVSESLMIGDDWEADILGARYFGMDQAFLTSTDELMNEVNLRSGHSPARHNYRPTYTIRNLRELMDILSNGQ